MASAQCTCGNNYGSASLAVGNGGAPTMEASFVHLPTSLLLSSNKITAGKSRATKATSTGTASHLGSTTDKEHPQSKQEEEEITPSNFLQKFQHLMDLEEIAKSVNEDDSDSILGQRIPAEGLSLADVERVRLALEHDTDRLEQECHRYQETMKEDRLRQESALRTIGSVWPDAANDSDNNNNNNNPDNSSSLSNNNNEKALLERYLEEIQVMQATCQSQQDEIDELVRLREEQAQLAQALEETAWSVENHRNALELEARGFDNAEELEWKQMSETMNELDQLSSIQLKLPALVLHLQVDKQRGLRYPLLNELRLAYRPKGDLKWNEIQAAWSLAAQLLLACGALLNYPSKYWKIVPLSSGAKLIHHSNKSGQATVSQRGQHHQHQQRSEEDFQVYNLGHPNSNGPQTLLAWNNLMYGIVQHASSVLTKARESGILTEENNKSIPTLPFDMTPTSIGGISLLRLGHHDDAGWSRAIHYSACNLSWLSDAASRLTLAEVLLHSY